MEASLLYCSVGCGRTPHAVSWNKDGVLAFAADKSVALTKYNNEVLQIFDTLHGHTEKVNCVQWITDRHRNKHSSSIECYELLSGSVDKTVRVWSQGASDRYLCVAELIGHTEPVTCITGMHHPLSHDTHVMSGSADSTVRIWSRTKDKDGFQQTQTLSFGHGFTMCMDCYYIVSTKTSLLVCGGDDTMLHIYRQSNINSQYERVLHISGHEDWIRDIHIIQEDDGDLLIASCSQDTYIRIWRLCETTPTINDASELKLEGNMFLVPEENMKYSVTLETVLLGHDDWVYGVHWQPLIKEAGSTTTTQPLCLLSVSMDKTMIIWSPDPGTGTWLDQVRMGDVGGNTLGLYGGVFGPTGDVIIAHGYQGAFHIWKKDKHSDDRLWMPITAPSGHFGPVQDLSWEPTKGEYLVSVSSDQTSRLHAPWTTSTQTTWHELARPQVHGYDMQCVAMITPSQFISGADEKVLRVFDAPQNFFQSLSHISGCVIKGGHTLPLGASVPSLGLSNKAVFNTDNSATEGQDSITKNPFADHIPSFTSIELKEPPLEEHLLQNTLWPETQKLYGHGYELYCAASSPNGRIVATACKASKVDFAAIRVWETTTWSQIAQLTHHTLTVTQLAFSHDSTKLLAVSRDRCWSLWNWNEDCADKQVCFTLIGQLDKSSKAHSRLIWSCSWSHDDKYFVTASRDKMVCVWSIESGGNLTGPPLELSHPATAVDFAPIFASKNKYLLAIGLENGEIVLVTFDSVAAAADVNHPCWSQLTKIHHFLCHSATVRRLQWKPHPQLQFKELVLASCGNDNCVRLLTINNKLSVTS